MCGILFTNDPEIERDSFLKALDEINHRGPDAPGGYGSSGNNQLGHNRLKIIDIDDRSNQPFTSSNGHYDIIFNGEIYNYKELAKEYNLKLRTKSDTEILLELYIQFGPSILNKLNGMFTLVILNKETSELFIARDRLGIKPLYYTNHKGFITFSSEIAPLISLYGFSEIDDIGLRQYIKLRTFFNGRTYLKNIQMFPAGHYMQDGKITKYWEFPKGEQGDPNDEEIAELLKSSVKYRCISDVEVGSYLSGGVDSTLIAALAEKVHSWTVGYPSLNEFEWGRMGAEFIGTTHREVLLKEEEFLSIATSMVQKRREPLSVPNEVLLYEMTKEVKKMNTVILSGEGADELFFGYDRIFNWAGNNIWDLNSFDELYSYGSHKDNEILEDVLAPFMDYGSCIEIVAAFFQVAHLHGLLRRLDNATMLCSVEARVPFVDHRLVERMAGVSFNYRFHNNISKCPLKSIFSEYLPKEIIDRKKVGFPVPLTNIFPDKNDPMDQWLQFNLDTLNISKKRLR